VIVAGVDGCPGGGWAVVTARIESERVSELSISILPDLEPLIDSLRSNQLDAIAVDMPIGLLADRTRASDAEARRLLGPRRSSVFPTPVRPVLGAADYADACERSRAAYGKAVSKQTFHLLDRIERLDQLVRPSDQDRLVEAHPEMAFTRLNNTFVELNKHGAAGRELRRRLLHRELPASLVGKVLGSAAAPLADLLDATVLVTTARRVVTGQAIRLGTEIDPTGKRAEITF
jgi:predicted RNase H-like nuclease